MNNKLIYLLKNQEEILSLLKRAAEPFVYLFFTFLFFLFFCLLWPDFVAMGERLRDYSLLSSVMSSPIIAREPWLVGENLNYYLYWYRLSAYWANILGLEVWTTYHITAAFSFSIFSTALFRIMRSYLNFSALSSVSIAMTITTASNLSGIIHAFSGDQNWWGPSRIKEGLINEFPIWSFILGDLHPHFLNLCLTPLIACFALSLSKCSMNWAAKLILILLTFTVSAPLYYNSNAWEVPIAGITFLTSLIIALYAFRNDFSQKFKEFPKLLTETFSNKTFLILLATLILTAISLVLSSQNIKPADYPWRLVSSPVTRSSAHELLLHWGIPVFSLFLALLLKIKYWAMPYPIIFLLFCLALSFQSAWGLILVLIIWSIIEIVKEFKNTNSEKRLGDILIWTFNISSLFLILLGELVFLDDPYGGENERMNTVFKIYSATWATFHLASFVLLYTELKSRNLIKSLIPVFILFLLIMPAFLAQTVELRKNSNPSIEGLASIEQHYQGSADAIRFLRAQSRKTVLESQGNPYSYTTHVSTLGGHDAYLGWANHVGLLTGKHDEVARREKISDEIYRESSCLKKKEIIEQEKIDLVVVGAIEKEKYGQYIANNFSCLNKVFDNGYYSIYR